MPRSRLTNPAFELLVHYARLHRDPRNITVHLVGVPLVLFAVAFLLSRAAVQFGSVHTTLAWAAFGAWGLWALSRGLWRLGLATMLLTAALVWAAHGLAALAQPASLALGVGLGLLALGWALQALGHCYEGRWPAVAGDLGGLLVAPMFVALELLAMAGWCRPLMARVEQAAGPTTLRDLAQPLTR